jgi:acetoacetyl-CoA synthetase
MSQEACDVSIAEGQWGVAADDVSRMPGVRWFPGTTVNYARNVLRPDHDGDAAAVIFRSEDPGGSRTLTFGELAAEVRAGLRALGVTKGDRVAAYVPNIPEAIVALLAVASLGAVWSSCSPDFGAARYVT